MSLQKMPSFSSVFKDVVNIKFWVDLFLWQKSSSMCYPNTLKYCLLKPYLLNCYILCVFKNKMINI